MIKSVIYCKACKFRMNVGPELVAGPTPGMVRVYFAMELEDEMALRCPSCGSEDRYMKDDVRSEEGSKAEQKV